MRKRVLEIWLFASAVFAAQSCLAAAEEVPADGEKWNAGVDAYRAGDAKKALAEMRPLMSSPTHGVRAAEVVAKLELDAARDVSETNALVHLESAAAAAQQALRATPDDPRANDNFTRAVDGLAELRETTRVNALVQAAQGKDQSALVKSAMDDSISILADAAKGVPASAAEQIAAADAAESKALAVADAWIPLKDFVVKNTTNENEASSMSVRIDEARARSISAARRLGEMDPGATDDIAAAEDVLSAFHKALVLPPQAIGECLLSQSNAWAGAKQHTLRTWNEDALGYTKSFRSKFDQWADMYSLQAQANTNMVPFAPQAREKIKELSGRLEAEQTDAANDPSKEAYAKALDTVREIIALMPVPPPQGGGQDSEQSQNPQNGNQDGQNGQNKEDDEDNGDDQSGEDRAPEEQTDQDDKEDDGRSGEKSPEEKEDEAVLRMIREKSAEHEDAKRRAAGEGRAARDW